MNLTITTTKEHASNAIAVFNAKGSRLIGVIPTPYSANTKDYTPHLELLLLQEEEILPPKKLEIHLEQGKTDFMEFDIDATEDSPEWNRFRLEFTRIILPSEIAL